MAAMVPLSPPYNPARPLQPKFVSVAQTVTSHCQIGARKSTQTFFESFPAPFGPWTSAPNRGRPHRKVCFPCGPGDNKKLFEPWASGRKGQECPREIRTEKFMFMLFSSLIKKKGSHRKRVSRVLSRKRELTDFCRRFGEFCEELSEYLLPCKANITLRGKNNLGNVNVMFLFEGYFRRTTLQIKQPAR